MAKIDVTKTELVWPGKYDEEGHLVEPPRVNLPFQVIETINESRASREAAAKPAQASLFNIWKGDEGETYEDGWKNKLIWGDNLPVMSSLLEKFAGKIDLIYIDPPFATGADFSFSTILGDEEDRVRKEPSAIEEKSYRDTWGGGLQSYLKMISARIRIMRDLLAPNGSIYVHMDYHLGHYVKVILDFEFGPDTFQAEIIWKRKDAQSFTSGFGVVHDMILYYVKGSQPTFNRVYSPLSSETADTWYTSQEIAEEDCANRLGETITKGTVRRYNKADISAPGSRIGTAAHYEWKGCWPPSGRHWLYVRAVMEELEVQGRLTYSGTGRVYEKRYLDESKGAPLQSIWADISQLRGMSKRSATSEWQGFDTQKPEGLLRRIIEVSSDPGHLVADFFGGSGTTLAVAEQLGRRWIGCDLGRFAIHTTRKRLLSVEGCKPFEILNLGKYERQYWQTVAIGRGRLQVEQTALEYIALILRLYRAEPFPGSQHIHGKKGSALVHVGAVDAPVTIEEINQCIDEAKAFKAIELHVLGWEWEMGLNDLMAAESGNLGIRLVCRQIPRDVMEEQAVDKGDVVFFELAYLKASVTPEPGLQARVELQDFAIRDLDLIPETVREQITKWSDYIDYWAVDWDFQNDTFMNGWQTYRTRKDRRLVLCSDPHTYESPGTYNVMVKVCRRVWERHVSHISC